MTGDLYQVDVRYACFGIVVVGDHVADAAPIGRWMVGKAFLAVVDWALTKGGSVQPALP